MIKYKEELAEIAERLEDKYFNYYCTVDFCYIYEAVENSLKDFHGEVKSIEEFHQNIKENYI